MKKRGSKLEEKFVLYWMGVEGPPLFREYKFDAERRWRFDFAHPASKTAIEIEGGIWIGGSHTRGVRYSGDCEKYNAAALAGWTVFRLTADMIQVNELEKIRDFIISKTKPSPA